MSFRLPRGIPWWVREAAGVPRKARAGQFIAADVAQRLADAAHDILDVQVVEYEVGVDYDATAYASSDVSFNARVYRLGQTADDLADAIRALERFVDTGESPGFDAAEWFSWQPFTEREAREVIADFAYSGVVPSGYAIEAVDWRRKKHTSIREWQTRRASGQSRDGDPVDLFNFRNILLRVGAHGLRVGAVKPDKL